MAHFQDEGSTKPPSLSPPSYKLGEGKEEVFDGVSVPEKLADCILYKREYPI